MVEASGRAQVIATQVVLVDMRSCNGEGKGREEL